MVYLKNVIGIVLFVGVIALTGTADDTTAHTPSTGFLKVYTHYTVENPNSDMELAYYEPYSIYSIDGELIGVIPRSLTEPKKISLPEGEYTITADLKGNDKNTIRVTVEAGKISVIK